VSQTSFLNNENIEIDNNFKKMVHSDNKKVNQSKTALNDPRYEYIGRNKEDKKNRSTKLEPKSVKYVNFRASSLINNEQNELFQQQQQQRSYRSLSPNQSETVAYVIGQQPDTVHFNSSFQTNNNNTKSILISKNNKLDQKQNSKVYFAQAIGHGQMATTSTSSNRKPLNELDISNTTTTSTTTTTTTTTNNNRQKSDEKFYEIHTEPLVKQRKRIRSPSGNSNQYYNIVSKSGEQQQKKKTEFKRDFNSLLNLANKASFRIRFARDKKDNTNLLLMSESSNTKPKNKIKRVSRSQSVNYLYNKRQFDLRKNQNNLSKIHNSNHIGFTTEDIEDIYMPTKLNQFESKLKASLDMSENSEQEETKTRKQLHHQSRSTTNNKRLKNDETITNNLSSPRIIINFQTSSNNNNNNNNTATIGSINSNKSYLEEAKRKLEENRNKTYYGNLNQKLKSSVTNVIRATHDLRRNLSFNNSEQQQSNNNNNSFSSDDIDNVYMPWMMENYGRKLVIESLKRRGNTIDTFDINKRRHKSPYLSQYYAQTNDLMPSIKRNDLWLIDKDIRRFVRKSRRQNIPTTTNDSSVVNMETEVSISDSETSSDDTRPIVPEKINKPDISLKNKILKTINKSLLSSELTGIDLNMLKLNDHVRKTSRRVEKKALERDLELDLLRSFSCNHLADLRREDIRYNNLRLNRHTTNFNSFTAEDILDLYMPKSLETYKLRQAIQKEKKIQHTSAYYTVSFRNKNNNNNKSPLRVGEPHIVKYIVNPRLVITDEYVCNDRKIITSPPPIQIKSPNMSRRHHHHQQQQEDITIRNNPNNLFTEIMQERLNDVDHKMAREISFKQQKKLRFEQKMKSKHTSDESEMDLEEDEAASTDQDQDDSLDHSSTTSGCSDDLNMNEDELRNFDMNYNNNNNKNNKPSSKSRIESAINRSLTLKNPGELISDFYISNMNYAMRYSVEHVQKFAKDLRQRRQRLDSFNSAAAVSGVDVDDENDNPEKMNRSFSVDRLYAVRREHIRYSNGADQDFGVKNISFTTDDIQDIYMPSSIDNYKRKIAVELERRRRFAENELDKKKKKENLYTEHYKAPSPLPFISNQQLEPVILDDLDLFLIKKANSSIEKEKLLMNQAVKSFQPMIQLNPIKRTTQVIVNSSIEPYRKETEAPIYLDTVDTISREPHHNTQLNRIQIIKPDIKFKSNNKKLTYMDTTPVSPPIYDRAVKLEKANVSVTSKLNDSFALVKQVSTLIDNEIVPSPSSSSITEDYATSSNETTDSLDNIDLDNFDPRSNRLGTKELIKINKLNRQIEAQAAIRLEAMSSFNHGSNLNINESRKIEKSMEYPNNKVNISIIKSLNFPEQQVDVLMTKSNLIEIKPQNTPREASYKIETNKLHTLNQPSNDIILLNAPKMSTENVVNLQNTKDLPSTPRANIKDPEYIIEEYAHKPIDSSIVYAYENVSTFKANKEPTLNKLKTSQEIPKVMSFVSSVNHDQILEDVGYLEPTLNEKHNANLTINKHVLSKLEAKESLIKLNAPVSNQENDLFSPPPLTFHSIPTSIEKANLTNHHEKLVGIEQPAHVLVPVNLNTAKECQDTAAEQMEVDLNLFNKEETPTKLKESKQKNETNNSIEWVKANVFNLAEIRLDSTESNYAHPFEAIDSDDIKQQLSQRASVQALNQSIQKNDLPTVFNSAQQVTEQNTLNSQCNEISLTTPNPSVATQKSEELLINLKPSIFKIATLNASVRSQSSFTDEIITEDDLSIKINQNLTSSDMKPHVDELVKPPIAKKPVIINQAKFSQEQPYKQESVIHINTSTLSDASFKQNILIKKHQNDLNASDKLQVADNIVQFNLAETRRETIEMQRLFEYRPNNETNETTKVLVIKEKLVANQRATQSSPIEMICDGKENNLDEFIESVKPMDTIEINFNEPLNLKTEQQHLTSPNSNKITIRISQSLNRPETVAENLNLEKCNEFILNESVTSETVRTTTERFTAGSVLIQNHPNKFSLPQESASDFNEEKILPIEIAPDYYQLEAKKEEINSENTNKAVMKKVEQIALGQINNENTIKEEEFTNELESIHLKLIEPAANKTVETKIDIVRLEKQHSRPETTILNNPVSNFIHTETVKRFQPEELDYERPKFGIEITQVNDDKKVVRIKMLNSPYYKLEEFDDQCLDRFDVAKHDENETEQQANSVLLKNDCDLKANIDHVKNYSMASVNEYHEEHVTIKETITTTRNLFQVAEENTVTNLNSFSHGDNDIKKVKLNHYGLAQEVIELNNADNTSICDKLEQPATSISIKLNTVPVDQDENIQTNINIKLNEIRSLADLNHLPAEQCENLEINIPDYSIPVHLTQTNTFEQTSTMVNRSSVTVQQPQDNQIEIKILNLTTNDNNKLDESNEIPDKKLMRWLNYPQSQLNDEDSTSISNVDEKLDFLYDKINSGQENTSEIEPDIVKSEKVLNRIISCTEKIESDYELVHYVTQCRPELQQLIINNESDFKFNEPKQNNKPICLNRASEEIENDYQLQDSVKIDDLIKQSVNKCDSVESVLVKSHHEEDINNHKTESTIIFNLPTVGKIARLDETSTEFYDNDLKENVSSKTVELICFETLNKIESEKTCMNVPLSIQMNENTQEIKSIDEFSVQLEIHQEQQLETVVQTPFQELIAPYINSYKYIEEKCNQFKEDTTKETLEIKTLPMNCELKQVCSLDQPIKWERVVVDNKQTNNDDIQKISQEIVKKVLFKSIIQSEQQPAETSTQMNNDWINDIKYIEPISAASNNDSIMNNFVHKQELKEVFANLNNTEDDIGSFIEQIEKIEVISTNNAKSEKNALVQHCIEEAEHVIHHSSVNATRTQFSIEKEKLNKLVQNIEVPKWEESSCLREQNMSLNELKESYVITNANDYYSTLKKVRVEEPGVLLNETICEDDVSLNDEASVTSNESSKIHLIESVEIVTHHDKDEVNYKLNDSKQSDNNINEKLIHIHKVDINRLQIREKSPRKHKDLDNNSRFKVDFKQEEVIDLRDLRENNSGIDPDETFEQNGTVDMNSDKVFARKFVDQIVQLSTSKLADFEAQHQNQNIQDYDDSVLKYENINFNKISNKSSSEILESLSNLKINIGKHLTESIVGNFNQDNKNSSMIHNNNKSIITSNLHDLSKKETTKMTSFNYDDDNDSLKEARDEFFENFDNRLHSTYNHGNSTFINTSVDTEDYFSEKFEEDIEIIKDNFQIPIHFEFEFNDQSFSKNKKVRYYFNN